jgi:CheY-like chemotaxis protein
VPPVDAPTEQRPDGERGMMATQEHSYRILITDDDNRCREALREIMRPQGYETLEAACGEEAIDIVRGGVEVHLVMLDMQMPTLTGLETLQLVRQINALLPAILVTADANESLMRQAIRSQVYSVIPKPVNKNVVLYTVIRALTTFYGPRTGPGG